MRLCNVWSCGSQDIGTGPHDDKKQSTENEKYFEPLAIEGDEEVLGLELPAESQNKHDG